MTSAETWKAALQSLRSRVTWNSVIITSLITISGTPARPDAGLGQYRARFRGLSHALAWHTDINERLAAVGVVLSNAEHDRLLNILYKHTRSTATLETSSVADALVHHPNYLKGTGSIAQLLRLRVQRSSCDVSQCPNLRPPIVEFTTSDGCYYLAKLFTKEHFEQESAALNHCLGRSSLAHYLSRTDNDEIEIFSLREKRTHKPVVTIEYQVSTKRIAQIKATRNRLIAHGDPFYAATLTASSSSTDRCTSASRMT
jgi:PcfJ-like protein